MAKPTSGYQLNVFITACTTLCFWLKNFLWVLVLDISVFIPCISKIQSCRHNTESQVTFVFSLVHSWASGFFFFSLIDLYFVAFTLVPFALHSRTKQLVLCKPGSFALDNFWSLLASLSLSFSNSDSHLACFEWGSKPHCYLCSHYQLHVLCAFTVCVLTVVSVALLVTCSFGTIQWLWMSSKLSKLAYLRKSHLAGFLPHTYGACWSAWVIPRVLWTSSHPASTCLLCQYHLAGCFLGPSQNSLKLLY